jgi:hypothetical protein
MNDDKEKQGKQFSADWLFRGVLTRLGEEFDRLAGRGSTSPSSLATSGLIERLKPLLEQEKVFVEGKGFVVPHSIKLKMQWDKFSANGETSLDGLSESLAIAAVDHINDSLYYTYAPVKVEINTDYFTEGVKLSASFEEFAEKALDAEHNVTMPNIVIPPLSVTDEEEVQESRIVISAVFHLNGSERKKQLFLEPGQSISVGRTGSNQLIIDDVSVSKVHASLVSNANGSLSVADTGSTNGTLVDGERIPYGKSVAIGGNSVVTFGTVEVQFEDPSKSTDVNSTAAPTPGDLQSDAGSDENRNA